MNELAFRFFYFTSYFHRRNPFCWVLSYITVQIFRLFQKKKNSSHCENERKIYTVTYGKECRRSDTL